MPTKLFLIRHGLTKANVKKQYSGSLNLGLNAQGRKQAKELSRRLTKEPIHKIYTSDKKRAIESARIIFKGRKIIRCHDLREINFGIFEGKCHREIMQSYPLLYQKWLDDPYHTFVPEAESLNSFQKRVRAALRDIASSCKDEIGAIVCHGATISIILSSICPSKRFWEFIPASGSLSAIEYRKNNPRIIFFNDTSHL
jgi:broad specificity phosphatase PhoE